MLGCCCSLIERRSDYTNLRRGWLVRWNTNHCRDPADSGRCADPVSWVLEGEYAGAALPGTCPSTERARLCEQVDTVRDLNREYAIDSVPPSLDTSCRYRKTRFAQQPFPSTHALCADA